MIDPLLIDLPAQSLTARLRIVPPASRDGAEMNRAIAESFVELHQWMDGARTLLSVDDSERASRSANGAARHARLGFTLGGVLRSDTRTP